MKGSTSNFVGSAAPASMGAASAANSANIGLAAGATPVWDTTNIGGLDDLISQYAELNAVKSKNLEGKLDPTLAGLRDSQEKDISDTYERAKEGNLPVGVQNALLRAGLMKGIHTGTGVNTGTPGNNAVNRVFGSGANDYLNQIRGMVNGYILQNPRQSAGIDPATAASVKLGMDRNNTNLANTYKQQLFSTEAQGNNNLADLTNGWLQSAAQEHASNAASKSAAGGQTLATIGTLAGAAAVAF